MNPKSEWKVLIVDHVALRTLSSCCLMHDVIELGVTIVEDLLKNRQPMPEFDAIYLMAPTTEVRSWVLVAGWICVGEIVPAGSSTLCLVRLCTCLRIRVLCDRT